MRKPAGKDPDVSKRGGFPATAEDEREVREVEREEDEWDIKDHLNDPVGNGQVLGDLFNPDGTKKN